MDQRPSSTPKDHDLRLHALLRETAEMNAESGMQPFLADRVMRRIQALNQPEEQLWQTLWLAFRPVALASMLLILGFVSYNTFVSRNYEVEPTPTEIVFGLQPLTLTTAYSADLGEFSLTTP
jgi:hypothetical protein